MKNKFFKILAYLALLVVVNNCGNQPLLTDKYQKFSVKSYNLSGNKKLGQQLSNKFSKIEDAQEKLVFNIHSSKARGVSNRSASGSALEYNIDIVFELEAISSSTNKVIFKKSFSEKSSYKASNLHINTLNREKKIIENTVNNIADQITTQLNLVFR